MSHPTYRGALLRTVRGWDAHDSTGARIGSYPEDQADAAVKKLRFIATEHST